MFKKIENWVPEKIYVTINGKEFLVNKGESVASNLLENGILFFKKNEVSQKKRAPYCMMGVCYDCLVEIDGIPNIQSCMVKVYPGMIIKTISDK
tara:strand:- start:688 stop:969 length:282 start_codon:yes stop_codon:yes gene_type:complete